MDTLDAFVNELRGKGWIEIGSIVDDTTTLSQYWDESFLDLKDPRFTFTVVPDEQGIARTYVYDSRYASLEQAKKEAD